jgi:hypothetical protein
MAKTPSWVGKLLASLGAMTAVVVGLDYVRLRVEPTGSPLGVKCESRSGTAVCSMDAKPVDATATFTLTTTGTNQDSFSASLSGSAAKLRAYPADTPQSRADSMDRVIEVRRVADSASHDEAFRWSSRSTLSIAPPPGTQIVRVKHWRVDPNDDAHDSDVKQDRRDFIRIAVLVVAGLGLLIGGIVPWLPGPGPGPLETAEYVDRLIDGVKDSDRKQRKRLRTILHWQFRERRKKDDVLRLISKEFGLVYPEDAALYQQAIGEFDRQDSGIRSDVSQRMGLPHAARAVMQQIRRTMHPPGAGGTS